MAAKEKKSTTPKAFKSAHSDPLGGIIFSWQDWQRKFVPELLQVIDAKVQELKLKLKFDKEPPQKQGMFNRLSNWWSNIFWGKHNKYHNPYYHRNILGALGAPSKKNEMTLGIYKIFKEASEKYELLTEKRLVMDDIIDNWLDDLNSQLKRYLTSVADNNYVPTAIIKAAYSLGGKTEDGTKGGAAEISAGAEAAKAAAAEKRADSGVGDITSAGTDPAGKNDTIVNTSANVTDGEGNLPPVHPDPSDSENDELEDSKPEVPASARVKSPKDRKGSGKKKGTSVSPVVPSAAIDPAVSPVVPPAAIDPAASPVVPPAAIDPASAPTDIEEPADNIDDNKLLRQMYKDKDEMINFLAATEWRNKNKISENPHGMPLVRIPGPGDLEKDMQYVATLPARTRKKLARNTIKAQNLDPHLLDSSFYDDIDLLTEIEAEEDEYDDSEFLVEPVDFDGLTLYERTLVCLEKLRKI